MTDIYPPAVQKERLLAFSQALNSSPSALRRDECGDPRIKGSRGHVHAVPGGFHLYCVCASKLAWTWAKKAMAFAKVTQDGDEEGMLLMDRLPTLAEAEIVRSYLGIRKRVEYSEDVLARKRETFSTARGALGEKPASGG